MIADTLRQAALFDELQLGSGINHALEQQRLSDFAFMLAMLSTDVMDQAWVSDPQPTYYVQEQLQRRFGGQNTPIPEHTPQHADVFSDNLSWYLAMDRTPQIQPTKASIPTNVLDNVSLSVQLKQRYDIKRQPLKQTPRELLGVLTQTRPIVV